MGSFVGQLVFGDFDKEKRQFRQEIVDILKSVGGDGQEEPPLKLERSSGKGEDGWNFKCSNQRVGIREEGIFLLENKSIGEIKVELTKMIESLKKEGT